MKKNYVVGILAVSALLLQSQAALAACGSANVTGKWNLVGSLFNTNGEQSYAFYCPLVQVAVGTGANKYSITPASACKAVSGGATGDYTVQATNTVTVNPTTCKVTGTFVLTHQANSLPVTILSGALSNPVGTATSKQGQFVARDVLNAGVVAFTLMR